jgi:hypothetical protein
VRRGRQQHVALAQGLAHQGELAVLEIAQAAVDEFRAGRGGVLSQVTLLAEDHVQPPPGGVPRDAGAVDAAADDQ